MTNSESNLEQYLWNEDKGSFGWQLSPTMSGSPILCPSPLGSEANSKWAREDSCTGRLSLPGELKNLFAKCGQSLATEAIMNSPEATPPTNMSGKKTQEVDNPFF